MVVPKIHHTDIVSDELIAYVCPGCSMAGILHPPLCPILVRYCAEDIKRWAGDQWQAEALKIAKNLRGDPQDQQHWREVTREEPTGDESTPAIVYDAASGYYVEYHDPVMKMPPAPIPRRPSWWLQIDLKKKQIEKAMRT